MSDHYYSDTVTYSQDKDKTVFTVNLRPDIDQMDARVEYALDNYPDHCGLAKLFLGDDQFNIIDRYVKKQINWDSRYYLHPQDMWNMYHQRCSRARLILR